jgi:hypothetical protein
VFAKGILQDHGFAWHVAGTVQGFAANTVAAQLPAPGTTVVDTGAPLITLTLALNPSYAEQGTPENDAPYPGTAITLPAKVSRKPVTTGTPRLEPVVEPQGALPAPAPTATPTPTPTPTPAPTPATTTTAVPPAPAPTVPVTAPGAPATTPTVTLPTTAPVSSPPRLPDFSVPGAPKEPAALQSLPDRVTALAAWLESHRDRSAQNVNHWLYVHAYVVAGARFGWWHGAEALQALIDLDRRAEALWGVQSRSRTTAGKALADVRARAG